MRKTAIFLHGAGGGGWEWTLWEPVFRKLGWRTIARDLQPARNGLDNTRLADYAAQIAALPPTDARPLALIGASMGGLLALQAATTLRADALVLINPVPPQGVSKKTPPTDYPPIVRWAGGPLQETRNAMPDSDETMIQFAWPRWRDESGAVMNEMGRGVALPNPSCPVLVIVGENDTDIAPETSTALATRLHADLHRYAATSHVGPLLGKRATEIAETTARWLDTRITR